MHIQLQRSLIEYQPDGRSRPSGNVIRMTTVPLAADGGCGPSSSRTKSPAGTYRVSPSLVWYSALPLSLTVSTRSGTLCQPTSPTCAGMRVSWICDDDNEP